MQYLRKAAAVSFVEHDRRTLLDKYHQERQRRRMDLGRVAHEFGPTVAARLFGTTPTVAAYWKKKLLNPEFHAGTWGGFRFVFSSVALSPSLSSPRRNACLRFGTLEDDIAAQAIIFLAIRSFPRLSSRELLNKLRQVPGMQDLTEAFLSRTISSWDFSWGVAEHVADLKFTEQNIREWIMYAIAILDVPLDRVR